MLRELFGKWYTYVYLILVLLALNSGSFILTILLILGFTGTYVKLILDDCVFGLTSEKHTRGLFSRLLSGLFILFLAVIEFAFLNFTIFMIYILYDNWPAPWDGSRGYSLEGAALLAVGLLLTAGYIIYRLREFFGEFFPSIGFAWQRDLADRWDHLILRNKVMKLFYKEADDFAVNVDAGRIDGNFSFFLRSFGDSILYNATHDFGNEARGVSLIGPQLKMGFIGNQFTLSSFLSSISNPIAPLIGLSIDDHSFIDHEPGFIHSSHEDWMPKVLRLLDSALFIFLIPSDRQSVVWETRQVIEHGWLSKTFFVMPPIYSETDHMRWEQAQVAARDWAGINLPDADSRGCIFQIKEFLDSSRVLPLMYIKHIQQIGIRRFYDSVTACTGGSVDAEIEIKASLDPEHPNFVHPYDR